jgi:hypothetical protein
MALTYTYKVTGLKTRDQVNSDGVTLTDAVVQTYWEMEGTDENGETAIHSGATPFTAENVVAGSFVSFSELTEETVIQWIKDYIASEPTYAKHIEEQILKDIDRRAIKDASLPWAPEEVTPLPGAEADPLEEEESSANTAP